MSHSSGDIMQSRTARDCSSAFSESTSGSGVRLLVEIGAMEFSDQNNGNHHRLVAKKDSKIERNRPVSSVHGFVLTVFFHAGARARTPYSKRSSIAIRPIGPQFTVNRFDQRPALPQFKQPSSTSTVSLSTASLSTSTMKSEAKHEQSFNPQPTARKSLFCTQVVLRIASIRTRWDLISTNVVSILIEKGIRHGCLDSITITSTVRRGGLSTSTAKSDARHEQSG